MKLKAGMAVCIEPMFNLGSWETMVDSDGWTVRTVDGSLSAHFEHTVAITRDGVKVMTLAEKPVDLVEMASSRYHSPPVVGTQ
jgi:methionine aminopeptidase